MAEKREEFQFPENNSMFNPLNETLVDWMVNNGASVHPDTGVVATLLSLEDWME